VAHEPGRADTATRGRTGESAAPVTALAGVREGIGLVAYRSTGDVDAIDEYSRRLVEALGKRGNPASYSPVGLPPPRRVDLGLAWILVQYNPFSYGRWGVAPGIVRDAIGIRHRLAAPLAVMVHEGWVRTHDWKSGLMGGYQRMQLRSLSRVANIVMATGQTLARELGPDSVYIPPASNITPVGASFQTARDRLGLGDELVVALFGRSNPGRALGYAEAAIDAIAQVQDPNRLLVFNLGADAPSVYTHPTIRVVRPGRISAEQLSLHLLASDLMLLPFTDGLSTRRTTLMAALAHGLPVLGLRSSATEDMILERKDVFALTPAGDQDAYRRVAANIIKDRGCLRGRGQAGRRLYLEHFDWPHVAARVMSAIESVPTTVTGARRTGRHGA